MKNLIIFLLLCALSISTASALTINIQTQDSFSIGEQMYFDYTITSNTAQQITFIPHIICTNAPIALLEQKIVTLQPNIPHQNTYTDMQVSEQFEPQTCTAYIQVTSPMQQRQEKTFEIDTLPSFDFSLDLDKTVFVKNEKINLDYSSEVSNPEITATLTSPLGNLENIQIPSTLNLDEIGTYIINAQASKEGYKTMQVSKQVGIIEQNANIQEGKISSGILKDNQRKSLFWIFLIIGALIIFIILVIIWFIKIKGSQTNQL
ncbi:MAG: hypothetical protein KKE50_06375 [Nanoarchaeota archaeon]|nr:hypothetical protein [Nanoarchaeota archaeon]